MKSLFLGFDALGRHIRLTPEERKAHMYTIGGTRFGKSKLMEWMMRQDLRNRQGFCLIDPHGTLYDAVVRYAAHHVLDREIILLNLAEPDPVIGCNFFQRIEGGVVSVQVDRRIAATLRAWGVRTSDETPTLDRTLRLIYTTIIEMNLGLTQARHLIDFDAREIRSYLIEQFQNELVQKEWREIHPLKRKEWRDETLSARNRLFRLLTSPTLARFMGLPGRSLDLGRIMDEGKVLLVNLAASDAFSSENARVFGALLVNDFYEAAKRRKNDEFGKDPKPYYLYIDEFQNFVTIDIGDMLDQVAKRGLFTVLAHQRFGQVDEDIIDAVFSNCQIKAVFGGLTAPTSRRIAEEIHIIDPMKVKVAIYQTKFWPKYERDTVYTKGRSHSNQSADGHNSGSAEISGSASSQFFQPGDWFGGDGIGGSATSMHNATSSNSSDSHLDSETDNESESEADIPILLPVPFKELSSIQYFSPDEQTIMFAQALKHQFQRHCFIKIHQQETQPMLVPFVEEFYTPPHNARWYIDKLMKQQKALPAAEVDKLLAERDAELLEAATKPDLPDSFVEKD